MKPLSFKKLVQISIIFIIIISCNQKVEVAKKESQTIIDDAAIADENQTSDWLAYGRTHNERRFFPSNDINTNTVANLKVD